MTDIPNTMTAVLLAGNSSLDKSYRFPLDATAGSGLFSQVGRDAEYVVEHMNRHRTSS
jgi:hypothetical protein